MPARRAIGRRASFARTSRRSWSRSPARGWSTTISTRNCWDSGSRSSGWTARSRCSLFPESLLRTSPHRRRKLAKILVVTSGKGGVGKTTTAAALATGLALQGKRTAVVDFDVGLRNLDLIMGCERRVVFDLINVINGDARISQALIRDKRIENLAVLPTSQTRDKDALTTEGVERVLEELREQFDYIICDSPAGIERGALMALYFADEAVIVTNPEVSSVRDSD